MSLTLAWGFKPAFRLFRDMSRLLFPQVPSFLNGGLRVGPVRVDSEASFDGGQGGGRETLFLNEVKFLLCRAQERNLENHFPGRRGGRFWVSQEKLL